MIQLALVLQVLQTAFRSLPLQTCAPLRLDVTGGIKPYTITIAAVAAPVVTNVSLGLDDDELIWFQRSGPNSQLIGNFWYNHLGLRNLSLSLYLCLISGRSFSERLNWIIGYKHWYLSDYWGGGYILWRSRRHRRY